MGKNNVHKDGQFSIKDLVEPERSWCTPTDFEKIDPDKEFLPYEAEVDPYVKVEKENNERHIGDYKDITDEYMNKEPKYTMGESVKKYSMRELEEGLKYKKQLKEAMDFTATDAVNMDETGEAEDIVYTFSKEDLEVIADAVGVYAKDLLLGAIYDDEDSFTISEDEVNEFAFEDEDEDNEYGGSFLESIKAYQAMKEGTFSEIDLENQERIANGEEALNSVDGADAMASSMELVDTNGESLPDYLAYDSSRDFEDSNGLDSLQHTHEAPKDEIGSMEESNKRRSAIETMLFMKEANSKVVLQEANASKSELINEYLGTEGPHNYNEFVKWATQRGENEIASAYYYGSIARKAKNPSTGDLTSGAVEQVEEKTGYDASTASDEYTALVNLFAAASEEDAQVEMSVAQKYEAIYATAYRTASGRALKKHAFICGSPGIGKTYSVLDAAQKGAEKAGATFEMNRGSIGKSLTAVLAFLYERRDGKVLLLDDADGFLSTGSEDVINTLKAAMDTDDPTVSTGGPHIRKALSRMAMGESVNLGAALNYDTSRIKEGILTTYTREGVEIARELLDEEDQSFWDEFTESTPKERSYLVESIYGRLPSRLTEDFLDDDDDDDRSDADKLSTGDLEGEDVAEFPSKFEFNSKLIFVSNMMQSDVPDAIAGRCNVKELYLTRPEIMQRLEQILPQLLKKEGAYSTEELVWAKANVFRWMKAVVEAEETAGSLTLGGGQVVNLNINTPITFRMFNDMVDGWMTLADAVTGSNPDASYEDIEKQIAIRFVSQVIIPAFTGDLRSKKKGKR